jgi:predicted DNA-binding antitoxin AbrB/MazE fold protein
MQDLTVIYEAGVFRPTTPLALPEGQTLQIRILPETPPLTLEQALQPLIRRGAITMPNRDRTTPLPEMPLSLTTSPSQTSQNPVSDIIIEDRGPL